MRRALLIVLLAGLLPLAACERGDPDALPPCPKASGSPVVAPGLTGRISFVTTGIPRPGFYHCTGIFVINADGSALRRITPAPETYPFEAHWSPDGRRFVFTGACPDTQHFELCLVDEDGTGLRPLSMGPGHVAPVGDSSPAWSPDGSKIVFSRRQDRSGPRDLYIVGADGTGEVRLTSDPGDESQAAWSPDGQTIAYIAREGTEQLRVIKASGGPSTVLVRDGTVNGAPAFSHDGRRIAFSSNRSGKGESAYVQRIRKQPGSEGLPVLGAPDIYVVGVDGKGLTRVTTDASSSFTPVWSPDDRHIAFLSDRDDRHSLYVMAADGTNVVRLSPLEAASPTWLP
jgi:Tol biopolymer transport system component